MNALDVFAIAYATGADVFVAGCATWFEFHRTLGKFRGFRDAYEFYFSCCLMALVWPVSLPAVVCVLFAKRYARRLIARREEQERIDRIVATEMALPPTRRTP